MYFSNHLGYAGLCACFLEHSLAKLGELKRLKEKVFLELSLWGTVGNMIQVEEHSSSQKAKHGSVKGGID